MSASRRLTEVMKKSAELVFDDSSRIVIIVVPQGDGGWSDLFRQSKPFLPRDLLL